MSDTITVTDEVEVDLEEAACLNCPLSRLHEDDSSECRVGDLVENNDAYGPAPERCPLRFGAVAVRAAE